MDDDDKVDLSIGYGKGGRVGRMQIAGRYVSIGPGQPNPHPDPVSIGVTEDQAVQIGYVGIAGSLPVSKGPKSGPAAVIAFPPTISFGEAKVVSGRVGVTGPGGASIGLTGNINISLWGIIGWFFRDETISHPTADKSKESKSEKGASNGETDEKE